jgi:protoheme IX farnesyltransferase
VKNDATAIAGPARVRTFTPFGDFVMLAKLRVNALVVFTTAGGYYMASREPVSLVTLAWTCLGTTLVASGAAAFNQALEADTDKLMTRTRLRPVAAGRISAARATTFGAALALTGLAVLGSVASIAALLVALATFVSYVWAYTPLKRRTSLATIVGAVPGALPPLIGWAAVTGSVTGVAPWSLFLIGFFWQLPHVLAISWMYRDEYRRAGIPVLPAIDPTGGPTGRQMVLWSAALVPCSLLPFLIGLTGGLYAIAALVMGVVQLFLAVQFLRTRIRTAARTLFYASIIYLPLLWVLMVAART